MTEKVVIIGPVSYVGGISVHISRKIALLSEETNFDVIDDSPTIISENNYLNIRKPSNWVQIHQTFTRSTIVHVHSGNWLLRLILLIVLSLYKTKVIVTLHSFRLTGLFKRVTELALSFSEVIIAVSEEISESLSSKLKNKIKVQAAFIPPNLNNEPNLPNSVKEILLKYRFEKSIICANAYRIKQYETGELYGLDQCIEVAKLAAELKSNFHLIFVIGTVKDEDLDYLKLFLDEIKNSNLEDYISVICESISFVQLINNCDLVLRPTLTDGDALTIREALYLKKPVISSDVVIRPKGTILYKNRDSNSLFQKITHTLNVIDEQSNKCDEFDLNYYKKFYGNLYR